ncbi:MAG: hypothetical protein AAF376_12820 [Pseudomonadota bacterium]
MSGTPPKPLSKDDSENFRSDKLRNTVLMTLAAYLLVFFLVEQSHPDIPDLLSFIEPNPAHIAQFQNSCSLDGPFARPTAVAIERFTMIARFDTECVDAKPPSTGQYCATVFVRTTAPNVCSAPIYIRGSGLMLGDNDPLLPIAGPVGDIDYFLFSHVAGEAVISSMPDGFEVKHLE